MPVIRTRLAFSIPSIEGFAIPGVAILIFFLAYTSQYLFYHIEPGPLRQSQAIWFNGFVSCIWVCYNRACTVDPGPKGWADKIKTDGDERDEDENEGAVLKRGLRWCKKCNAVKPPRAHHCRQCGRYTLQSCLDRKILKCADVFPKWIITVLGPRTASRIRRFPISFASSSTQSSACPFSPTIFSYE